MDTTTPMLGWSNPRSSLSRETYVNSALVVEVTRGDRIESRHEVDAVVVDPLGRLVGSWVEPHRAVLPRSALKPIQALPWWTPVPPTPSASPMRNWPWPAPATRVSAGTRRR